MGNIGHEILVAEAASAQVIQRGQAPSGGEFGLVDLFAAMRKQRKLMLALPALCALLAAAITAVLPDIYTGRTVIMPPQPQQSATAAMLGTLGALAGLAPSVLGIKSSNDLYVGMLKSRTMADALIAKFDLKNLYDERNLVETRKTLARKTSITAGKDGLIVIEVDDRQPERAAAMANAYADELHRLTGKLAVTEAAQRRLFFEGQVAQAKDALANAEQAFKQIQEKTGLVQLDQQGRAMIQAVATLKAHIMEKEVGLAAMRQFATDANPELVKVQKELALMKGELAKLRRGSGDEEDDFMVPVKSVPTASLEYLRKYRDVKYSETVFELLAKQYELAKIDEARDAAVIQVLDRAIVLDDRSKPSYAINITVGVLIGIFLAVLVVIWRTVSPRLAPAA
jgi:tyrosine-protein kinase Etk/Wzc